MASGTELAFADADDRYEPDMLMKLHEAMMSHDADMVACGYFEEFPDRIEEHGTGGISIVFNKIEAYKDYSIDHGSLLGLKIKMKAYEQEESISI